MRIPSSILKSLFISLIFVGLNLLFLSQLKAGSYNYTSPLDTTYVDTLLYLCGDNSLTFYENEFSEEGNFELFIEDSANDNDTVFYIEILTSNAGPFNVDPEEAIVCLGEPLTVTILENGIEAEGLTGISWQNPMWFTCDTCSTTEFNGLGIIDFTVDFLDQDGCPQSLGGQYETVSGCLIEQIVLPNVFTPNGDEVNDYFEPLYSKPYQKLKDMKIYNRFGELIFQSNEERGNWDGEIKDQPAPMDIYYYQIEVNCPALNATEVRVIKGQFTLLR